MTNIFSRRLKEARLKKGLSLDELAKAIGTTKSTISKYENSLREPKMLMAKKIADCLNVSFNWLIGYTDKMDEDILLSEITLLFYSLNEAEKKEVVRFMKYLKYSGEEENNKY